MNGFPTTLSCRWVRHLVGMAPLIALFISSCTDKKETNTYAAYIDTAVQVYGPYVAVKLPITKGVPIGNPIQIALGPEDLLYAANQTGEVYTLHDSDNDGLEDSTALYCHVSDFGLKSPVGFAHRGDTIYIGTSQQIRAFRDDNKDGVADTSWLFFDRIPNSEHPYEWTSGLSFGPDGWLYVALTTDSWNAAPAKDSLGYRGAIIRISPNGSKAERVATGIRSVPGMAFHKDGDLFFVDNEGGGNPTEELNRLTINSFYGHNKKKYPSESGNVTSPEFDLQSEVAPSALEFNAIDNDFGGTAGDLFVTYYGPGERWTRGAVGRVVMKRQPDGKFTYQEYTIADMAKISDLAFSKEGHLYLAHHGEADYWYNSIYPRQGGFYKLIHDPSVNIAGNYVRPKKEKIFSKNSVEMGKQLFAELGCLGCHQVDGKTEQLGPNLKGVSKNYSRSEILEAITQPSKQIKPSMMGVRITKKDGQQFLGRIVTANEDELSLMLVGNQVISIARKEIEKSEDEKKSLMFEGLLGRQSEENVNALLDFLMSLE